MGTDMMKKVKKVKRKRSSPKWSAQAVEAAGEEISPGVGVEILQEPMMDSQNEDNGPIPATPASSPPIHMAVTGPSATMVRQPRILVSLDAPSWQEWRVQMSNLLAAYPHSDVWQYIDRDKHATVRLTLGTLVNWQNFSVDEFFAAGDVIWSTSAARPREQLLAVPIPKCGSYKEAVNCLPNYHASIMKILDTSWKGISLEADSAMVNEFQVKLMNSHGGRGVAHLWGDRIRVMKPKSMRDAVDLIGEVLLSERKFSEDYAERHPGQEHCYFSAAPHVQVHKAKASGNNSARGVGPVGSDSRICWGCGSAGHSAKICPLRNHPNFNDSNVPWAVSEIGRRFKNRAAHPQSKLPVLFDIENNKLDGAKVYGDAWDALKERLKPPTVGKSVVFSLGKLNYLPGSLICQGVKREVKALVDTGSSVNVVSSEAAAWLRSVGAKTVNVNKVVRWGLNDAQPFVIKLLLLCNFEFYNELVESLETIDIALHVAKLDGYDVIIGRPCISHHGLLRKLEQHLDAGGANSDELRLVDIIATTFTKEELIDYTPDNDETGNISDIVDQFNAFPETLEDRIPKQIFGSASLKAALRKLCVKHNALFSRFVKAEPAKVTPFKLEVDEAKWRKLGAHGGPRPQSSLMQEELARQIVLLEQLKVIVPSLEATYSHALMVPKPKSRNSWRFCVDYRILNAVSVATSWPIPLIAEMLNRIASKRPRLFCIMDLTSGYHQMPVEIMCRRLTAFITSLGVYEWSRVPMGLRGAGAYFQKVMTTEVLNKYVRQFVEIYLDDVLVFGRNEGEIVENLEKVFSALSDKGITLNPDKCIFGVEEVEFVGHVISHNKRQFSKEKTSRALDFPLPSTVKELQSFLGLVNYFRDHIPGVSELTHPLFNLISHGAKGRIPLKWTEEATVAFNSVKAAVEKMPSLYFLQGDGEIRLYTDASDYGIGAYLFQYVLMEGVHMELPVRFISKTLNDVQCRWSTIEKECYAIFYALREFNYLLGHTSFKLFTDHKNLLYMNDSASPKVVRWKLEVQEHDFVVEHTPGPKNLVADALSRLCYYEDNVNRSSIDVEAEVTINGPIVEDISPSEIQRREILRFHNVYAGHHGVDRTCHMIKEAGFDWPYLREHVRHVVKTCARCQRMSVLKPAIHGFKFSISTLQRMQRVAIDAIGPFPISEGGYEHILVFIDTFTRWVELYPIKDVGSLTAVRCLIDFVGRFGVPKEISTDAGSQFKGLVPEVLDVLKTKHMVAMSYSKQENGIVERANREVLRHLRAILDNVFIRSEWDRALPFVQRILNTAVHSATNCSAYELVFGEKMPGSIFGYSVPDMGPTGLLEFDSFENSTFETHEEANSFVQALQARQLRLIRLAAATQLQYQKDHLAKQRSDTSYYPPNTWVLVAYPETRMRISQPTKLDSPWYGPVRVIRNIGNKYTILDTATGKFDTVHISRLKLFEYDSAIDKPGDIAVSESGKFYVEKVISHRQPTSSRLSLEFLIHWSGYPDEDDTWESWSGNDSIRSNAIVHQYMRANRLSSLIPARFRSPASDPIVQNTSAYTPVLNTWDTVETPIVVVAPPERRTRKRRSS